MKPMYLPEIENNPAPGGPYADAVSAMQRVGVGVPQIMHLFAFKPGATDHLSSFTQAVMRGPSPLPPGFRELIAAFTSRLNDCLF
jgi:alkylhydroperoxidase family enzyme